MAVVSDRRAHEKLDTVRVAARKARTAIRCRDWLGVAVNSFMALRNKLLLNQTKIQAMKLRRTAT